VDLVPDPLLLRNLVASEIEPGPLDLYAGVLTTRSQRRSARTLTIAISFSGQMDIVTDA
jgi:hypothetical protein